MPSYRSTDRELNAISHRLPGQKRIRCVFYLASQQLVRLAAWVTHNQHDALQLLHVVWLCSQRNITRPNNLLMSAHQLNCAVLARIILEISELVPCSRSIS